MEPEIFGTFCGWEQFHMMRFMSSTCVSLQVFSPNDSSIVLINEVTSSSDIPDTRNDDNMSGRHGNNNTEKKTLLHNFNVRGMIWWCKTCVSPYKSIGTDWKLSIMTQIKRTGDLTWIPQSESNPSGINLPSFKWDENRGEQSCDTFTTRCWLI